MRAPVRGRAPALLWVVLGLVLASFGLLVAALVTSRTGWAWGSVGASGIAAGLLVADWTARRRTEPDSAEFDRAAYARVGGVDDNRSAPAKSDDDHSERDDEPDLTGASTTGERDVDENTDAAGDDRTEPAASGSAPPEPNATAAAVSNGAPPVDVPDAEVEPPEESTDAADAIVVSELTDEVVVIDERPRYHLRGCQWVGQRRTLPLPLDEARELGFTPCAVCRPDFTLAAGHRATRR